MNASDVNYTAAKLCDGAYEDASALLRYAINSPAHITGARYGADVFIFEGVEHNYFVARGLDMGGEFGLREIFNALRFARKKVDGSGDTPLGIHEGFYSAYHEISDLIGEEVLQLQMEQAAEDRTKPWVFCGHSAGGAIATIAAAVYRPDYLVTFGAPRCSGSAMAGYLAETEIFRWVNGSDWVPRVPVGFGYRHHGDARYVGWGGNVRVDPSPVLTGLQFLLGLPWSQDNHMMRSYLFEVAALYFEVER